MKDLLKTTSVIGFTEVLLMFVALARNKYLALTIGPEGFGIYGLLSTFFMMIAVFSSTWMAAGTIKYTSEYYAKGDKESLNSIFSFSTIIATGIGIFLTIILIVWRKWLIITFLSSEINEVYYLIFCAAFLAICLRPIFLGVLQGLRRIKEVVISRWSIAIFNLIFTVILVWFWDLTGFFISLLVNAIFAIIILYWGIKRNGGLQLKKISWQDPIVRLLLVFGSVNLLLALMNLSSQYFQRGIILHNMDISAVGLFHAGVALMGYLGIINRGSSFYFIPKMSEELDNVSRNKIINEYLRFILLFSIPVSVVAILFGKWAIILLYSSEFIPLVSVFFLFVIGQFIGSIGGVFQSTVVGMAKLKMHSASSIVIHSLWVIIPFFLINKYGLGALGLAFILGGLAGGILNWLYLRNKIKLRFNNNIILLFLIAVPSLTGAILLSDSMIIWRIILIVISAGLMVKMIRYEEWMIVYNYLLIKFKK